MEPDVLVGGEQPGQTGTNDTNDVTKHRYEDQTTVEGEDQTRPSGRPNGPFEAVQSSEFRIRFLRTRHVSHKHIYRCSLTYLTIPSIAEEEEVETVEDNIEGEPPWGEQLPTEPAFGHDCCAIRC